MIVLLAKPFPPQMGGIENLMDGLARALCARGNELAVFGPPARKESASQERQHDSGAPFKVTRLTVLQKPFAGLLLKKFLKQRDVGDDLIFIADSWKRVERYAAALPPRAPVFCLAHGNELLNPKNSARKARRISRAFACCRAVVANSRHTAALAAPFLPEGKEAAMIAPGIFAAPPPNEKARAKMDALCGNAAPLITTVARLEPRKGVDKVLAALPAARVRHPHLRYVVAGGGKDLPRLQSIARARGVEGAVVFAGPLAADEKTALLRRADLFAMPARALPNSVEGFGIVYLEAAECGAPALAGEDGGAADAVVDGETGWLCDGGSDDSVRAALLAALSDENERRRRAARAQARAANFHWEKIAAQWEALLRG